MSNSNTVEHHFGLIRNGYTVAPRIYTLLCWTYSQYCVELERYFRFFELETSNAIYVELDHLNHD